MLFEMRVAAGVTDWFEAEVALVFRLLLAVGAVSSLSHFVILCHMNMQSPPSKNPVK